MAENDASPAPLQPPWEPSSPKPGFVYSVKQVAIGTWLGGPFAAAWFIGSNARQFGREAERQRIWLYAAITAAILMPLCMWVPTDTPNSLFPAIYCGAAYFFVIANQKRHIEQHLASGQPRSSNWRVAGVSLAHLVALLLLFVGTSYFLPIKSWNTVVVDRCDFTYEGGATREDVERLSAALRRDGWIDSSTELSFTLKRSDGIVTIAIPFESGEAGNAKLVSWLKDFRSYANTKVFPEEHVVVVMANIFGSAQMRIGR